MILPCAGKEHPKIAHLAPRSVDVVQEVSPVIAPSSSHPPFARPSDKECVALGLVARYFLRAGTQAATLLLGRSRIDPEAELLASLSDTLLQGAALCDWVASVYAAASPCSTASPIGGAPISAGEPVVHTRQDDPRVRADHDAPRRGSVR